MAICSPDPRANFIERTLENDKGGLIGKVLLVMDDAAGTKGSFIEARKGYDVDWVAKYKRRITNALPMDWADLEKYFIAQGWMNPDGSVLRGNAKGTAGLLARGEEGMAVAVAKTYMESVGAGIKQLADNFQMKVKMGEDATREGLALAQQMQHAAKFSSFVLEGDQAYGRAVRTQGLRNNVDVVGRSVEELGLSDVSPEQVQAFGTVFEGIAAKMGSSETYPEAINELIDLAKRVQMTDSPIQAFRISGSMELAGDMWRETWINGLLSAPGTIITNMAAFTWAYVRPASQYLAAQAAAGLTGSAVAQQAALEASTSLAAMSTAWGDGLKLGWQAFKTEQSIYAPLTGRTELARGRGITSTGLNAALKKNISPNIPGLSGDAAEMFDNLGRFVRLPSRALLGSDEFVKHLAIRGEVAARGVKQAVKNGVDLNDPTALKQYLETEYSRAFKLDSPDPRQKWTVDLAYEYASEVRNEANRVTFQEQNSLASGINQALQTKPGTLVQPFVPFVRTPLNILKQGFLESTGLEAMTKGTGYFLQDIGNPTNALFKIQRELLEDPGESFRIAGQMGLTGALSGFLYMGVMNNTVTGGGPGRWMKGGKAGNAQKAWERAMAEEGRTKYSIATPFGQVPFERLGEPISIFLRMVTDVAQYSSYMNAQEKDISMAVVSGIAVSGLYQASFLKGIDNLMSAMFNDDDAGRLKVRALEGYTRTQLPFGSLLNYVDKINDPYRKVYENTTWEEVLKVHEGGLGLILERVADRIPGMGDSETLVDQVTGEPMPVYPGGGPNGLNPFQLAIPFAPRGVKSADQTWSRVMQIMGTYQEAKPSNVTLTQNEQQQLNKRMAGVQLNGQTFQQWINRFYSRYDVQELVKASNGMLPDRQMGIKSEFNRMKRKYMDAALDEMTGESDNLLQRRMLAERIKQKNNANDLNIQDEENQLEALLQQALTTRVF